MPGDLGLVPGEFRRGKPGDLAGQFPALVRGEAQHGSPVHDIDERDGKLRTNHVRDFRGQHRARLVHKAGICPLSDFCGTAAVDSQQAFDATRRKLLDGLEMLAGSLEVNGTGQRLVASPAVVRLTQMAH